MNLLFRLLYVLIRGLRGPRLQPMGESVVPFRVLPTDLDFNLHMNNGRYLTLMDLGRLDLMLRQGVVGEIRRRRWNPVVGSAAVRFRRPLNAFQRFELRTRLVCWDERWLYLEQRCTRGGEVMASALIKALFIGPEGRVPPSELAAATGHPAASPPMPEGVRRWLEAEEEIHGTRTLSAA
jgi:acyl-CoA thioesterase FadM